MALARNLYQDPETFIFDDVMSALDAKVGSFIMEETILKQLKSKTVLLVTHGLQYLRYSDYIYVMDEGKVLLEGKYEQIKETELYKKFEQLGEWTKNIEQENKLKAEKEAELDPALAL